MSLFAPFVEAILQAKRRKVELSQDFYGRIPAEGRARAFTVSGLAAVAQIEQVLNDLVGALEQGLTFEQWRATAMGNTPSLASLPKGRLQTIYRNAMLNAYNAGRYEQLKANPRRKYWLYDGVIDSRTTDVCRALDGKIYAADNPVWRRIMPPNHHNCRSSVIGLTYEQAVARGYRGTDEPVPADGEPENGWAYNPGLGLNDTLNATADVANSAVRRQYVPPVAQRQALADWAQTVVRQAEQTRKDSPEWDVLSLALIIIMQALAAAQR